MFEEEATKPENSKWRDIQYPFLNSGTASLNYLSNIIGTHGPKGFQVYRKTN